MRITAFLALLAALAGVAWAGAMAWSAYREPLPGIAVAAAAPSSGDAPGQAGGAELPGSWPALFGRYEPQPPAPPEPPAPRAEPQPPAPPAPPIESLGYTLRGVVSDGETRWALVSHPTGEILLRVGDRLGETYTVTAIDAAGLWGVSSPGAAPQLLELAE